MRRGRAGHGPGLALALALGAALSPLVAEAQVRLHNEAGGNYSIGVTSWSEMPFRTIVRQRYDYSCGSAALATLLTFHYGRPTGEPDAFRAMYAAGDQAKIRKLGFSLLDMKSYLQAQGFKADGYRMSFEQLSRMQSPAIALIQLGRYRHFIVIKGVRNGVVLVGDPALGLHEIPAADFKRLWNGVVFAIDDDRGKGAFNLRSEWDTRATAPFESGLSVLSLSALTRELAPLYQITPLFALNPSP
jgi:predicted double-glycine peptidase